jgi:hypothetical protein
LSDPFGLKVCYEGSPSEVEEMRSATERFTNSSIRLDRKNCVRSHTPRRNSEGFQGIQAAFGEMVRADVTFTVQYSRHKSHYNPLLGTVRLFHDWDAYAYATRVGGECRRGAVAFSDAAQILAHEFAHAYRIGLQGNTYGTRAQRLNEEHQAMIWENIYNAATGRPGRCAY